MDKNKQYKIALVIKNEGLEYDDRVRKEILTIQHLYPNISFKIFAMLPNNKETEGITGYGIPYRSIYIQSRQKYPSSKRLVKKMYEFHSVIKDDLEEYDAIWCGDRHCLFTVALANKKHLLWDLHELPTELLSSKLKRRVLKYLLNRCRIVVHANPQRAEYLQSIGVIKDMKKHYAIRNYPNFNDIDSEYDEKYKEFVKWKDDRRCVYLQGLNDDSRAAFESVSTVMEEEGLTAVVVGGFDKDSLQRLKEKWGSTLDERIFFAGKIPQLKIPQYVQQCITTLVFYKNVRPNNFYCEANRFYQSVIMGLPVVVGNNPPMKELVEKYDIGISIDDDGRDIEKIKQALETVLNNYDYYVENNKKYRNKFLWDQQETVFKEIIEKLLQ